MKKEIWKKIAILAILGIVVFMSKSKITVQAASITGNFDDVNRDGKYISWSYDDVTETLTISGEGEWPDRVLQSEPFISMGTIRKIAFENCKVIGDMSYAFGANSFIPSSTYLGQVEEIDFSGGLDTSNVTNMSNMFFACMSLTSLDLSGFDTSKVTNMSSMFSNCHSLTSLDVSGFDTSNVTSMLGMFALSEKLTSLDVSGFDTSKVTDMSSMFSFCEKLTNLDVSRFDTSKVTNMNSMFTECRSLTSLDVSRFDTSRVTGMYQMFSGCNNLTSLDVSGFNTGNVTRMDSMFSGCSRLISLDVSGFDTSRVTTMYNMFFFCSNLTRLDVSGFNTGNVTRMDLMFSSCSKLISLDVSRFDTSRVTNMCKMFFFCSNLTKLDLSGFDTSKVTDMSNMFTYCSSLSEIRTPKKMGNIVIALPTVYYTPKGIATNEITKNFLSTTLTSEWKNESVSVIDYGKVQTSFKKSPTCETSVSFEWSLDSLINIGNRNKSLAILGLLLSKDAYDGTDSVAKRMIDFGLLDKKNNIREYQDPNTNTGTCFYVSVKKVEKGNEEYYIVTAVSRGTTGDFSDPEWLNNIFFWRRFFKARGDELYTDIKKALESEGLEMNDSRLRYFITGHSLGGAVSNYLSNKMLRNGVRKSQVACYTYGCPFTYSSEIESFVDAMQDAHIYNYIGIQDVVPTVGQATNDLDSLAWGTERYGNDLYMTYETKFVDIYNSIYSPETWKHKHFLNPFSGSTAGNLSYYASAAIAGDGGAYHDCSTYLAQILADEIYTYKILATMITVLCPVDIYVYDATGNVVASVVDNTVVNAGNEDVAIAVIDDAKFLTLRNEGNYSIKFIGTDTGTMNYIVTENTATGETVKTFSNVLLEKDKQMISFVREGEETQNVQLFVMDENQKVIREIDKSGVETAHIHNVQWLFDSTKHWHGCNCGYIEDQAVPHIWNDGVVSTSSTGSKVNIYTCTVCGATRQESIDTHLPNTDAQDNIKIHISVFLSFVVLTIVVYKLRRRYMRKTFHEK